MKPVENDTLTLKRTKTNREFGMRCGSSNPQDGKVWPGEKGTVRVFQGNGWKGMEVLFSRGRTVQVGTLYETSESWEYDDEKLAEFKKVRT